MFRLTSTFLLIGAIVVASAYPPGYVPQRCQDDDGTLLPSATDCEDESDLCPTLFGNITTDVRAKACNSEIDVVKEGVMMCAKTCKVCCEKPKPPTPEPVTPHPYPLRCQDENGDLLPSATDCEDESDLCPVLFGNITTDVRANICNGEIDAVKEGVMMCAKTCKVCCEKPQPPTESTVNESTTIEWGNDVEPTTLEPAQIALCPYEPNELDYMESDIKPHCQYSDGTLMESARNCEDKYPQPCIEMFAGILYNMDRPLRCYTKALQYFAVNWCPKTCSMCCEPREKCASKSS